MGPDKSGGTFSRATTFVRYFTSVVKIFRASVFVQRYATAFRCSSVTAFIRSIWIECYLIASLGASSYSGLTESNFITRKHPDGSLTKTSVNVPPRSIEKWNILKIRELFSCSYCSKFVQQYTLFVNFWSKSLNGNRGKKNINKLSL